MSSFKPSVIYENIYTFFEYRGVSPEQTKLPEAQVQKFLSGDGPYIISGKGADGELVVAVYLDGSKHLKAPKNFLASVASLKPSLSREVIVVIGPGLGDSTMNKYLEKCNALLRPNLGRAVKHLLFQAVVPRNVLVPKHEPLSDEQVNVLERHFYLDKKNIASFILWQTDPACIWCGAKPGQVVRITYPSDTAGESIDYRLCV